MESECVKTTDKDRKDCFAEQGRVECEIDTRHARPGDVMSTMSREADMGGETSTIMNEQLDNYDDTFVELSSPSGIDSLSMPSTDSSRTEDSAVLLPSSS